jgi:quinol monooxygenase YgiN
VVIVIARWRPRPERRDDLEAVLRDVQEASRADEGCLNYGYYSNVADPSSFIAVEEWRDEEALREHLRTPHVARLVAALPEMVEAGGLEIAAHEVASTGPLPFG